jgi:hypothetical protein
MPRLTDKQREERRKKLQQEALESVAERGQFNFRLDGQDIKRLYELAGRRQKPVSAMVREWVLERLHEEETSKYPTPPWAQELQHRVAHTEILMALLTLENVRGAKHSAMQNKLREHIVRHCDFTNDQELRDLLST